MMNSRPIRILVAGFLTAASLAAAADVNDTSEVRRLSLPGSPVQVVLPREDWALNQEQRPAGEASIYYVLWSQARQAYLSVRIERTNACASAESCLDAALANPAYRDAQGLERAEQGPFRLAKFHVDDPRGAPLKQANVLASAYAGGVRIDLHLTKVGRERPELDPLVEFLREVSVR